MQLYLFFILLLFISCKTRSLYNTSIGGYSYILVTQNNDSIEVEFMKDCLKTFSSDYHLPQEWRFNKTNGNLYFDGTVYTLTGETKDKVMLSNKETKIELMKVNSQKVNKK